MRKETPSKTARKVALNIVTLGAKPGMEEILPAGIVDTTSELLVASGATGETAVRWSRTQRMMVVYEWFDWMLPGQFEAFAHRKAFCEQQVRDGIDSGAAQILVLGAGYDTLGWRLAPEFPGVIFFEIDHPATARLKAKGIAVMGHRDNLIMIAEDLAERKLQDVLKSNPLWAYGAPAVIIAEGLVMYLPPEAVRELFSQCASVAGGGSRIAFSYIPQGRDGRPYVGRWTGLMLWLQKFVGGHGFGVYSLKNWGRSCRKQAGKMFQQRQKSLVSMEWSFLPLLKNERAVQTAKPGRVFAETDDMKSIKGPICLKN